MKPSGFSPRARWDRHISETQDNHSDPNRFNERIELLVHFKAGKIYPRVFFWHNRKYKIKRITYNWQERKGEEIISYFSVDTGADLYQISFNHKSFGWKMERLLDAENP